MKTFKLLMLLGSLCFSELVQAQDTIYVSDSRTTAIEFPARISSPVNQNNLVAVVKDNNILTVKASKDFSPSHISIKTEDGKDYHFPVAFSYGRAGRFYRLSDPQVPEAVDVRRSTSVNESSSNLARGRIRNIVTRDRKSQLKAKLGQISVSGNSLFYKVNIENGSNLAYDLDFVRFYVRDLKTAKRTVTQEQELYPMYAFGASQTTIAAKENASYVFTFKKFPLSKGQALFMEIYEKNGARHLYLKVKAKENRKAQIIRH